MKGSARNERKRNFDSHDTRKYAHTHTHNRVFTIEALICSLEPNHVCAHLPVRLPKPCRWRAGSIRFTHQSVASMCRRSHPQWEPCVARDICSHSVIASPCPPHCVGLSKARKWKEVVASVYVCMCGGGRRRRRRRG